MKIVLIIIIAIQTCFTSYLLNVDPIIHTKLSLVKTKKPVAVKISNNQVTKTEIKNLNETETSPTLEITSNIDDQKVTTTSENIKNDFEEEQKVKAKSEYKKVEEEKELFWWSRQLNFNAEQEAAFSNLLAFIEESAANEADLNYPDSKRKTMEWFKLYYQTKEELLIQGAKEIIPQSQLEKFNQLLKRTESFQFSVLH